MKAELQISDWPVSGIAVRGREVYRQNCIGCHGDTGRGDGTAAGQLSPPARDFQKGYYKFRTTPSGMLPTEDDVLRTVTCGLPGSSMPSFRLMSEPDRRAVVAYVLQLTAFGLAKSEAAFYIESEGLSLAELKKTKLAEIREKIRTEKFAAAVPIPVPPEPKPTPEGLERGRARYEKECQSCHGKTGVGDGPSALTLRDWQDAEIRPRDFTSGVFRAGSTSRDLFIRLRTGLNGTPMPEVSGRDEDLWDLVHFMKSLVKPGTRKGNVHQDCGATEAGR